MPTVPAIALAVGAGLATALALFGTTIRIAGGALSLTLLRTSIDITELCTA